MHHPLPTLIDALACCLKQRGWMLATAESCTGGMIAAACTDVAGSSTWFDRGFVTYSNAAKADMLGVPPALIAAQGAVSQAVAAAMALGALQHSSTQAALAVTGVAGPGGGSPDKPVGTVWFGWAIGPPGQAQVHTACMHWQGDRHAVRTQTTHYALQQLLQHLRDWQAPSPSAAA